MRLVTEDMLHACGVGRSERVLVGLSGGADSTALTHALCVLKRKGALAGVCAAHLHHGIRGAEADADADACRALCAALGIPLKVGYVNAPAYAKARGLSLEQAARTLRYAFFAEAKAEQACGCIAVAHQRDDQAETVLLHLLRGSGTAGLAAMRPRNGDIVRPMLTVSRAEVLRYLAENNLTHCEDSTNACADATRNRVRNELMPLLRSFNPQIAGALCRLSALAAVDEDCLGALAGAALFETALADGNDRGKLSRQPEAVRTRALKTLLFGCCDTVTNADIRRVDALLTARTGTRIELINGKHAWVDADAFHVGAYPAAQAYETPFCPDGETRLPNGALLAKAAAAFQKPVDGNEAYLDRDALPKGLVVRTRRSGDRFYPLGAPGSRKLSDVLTDRKIPVEKRDMPLLCAGNEVYYAVGVGASERARVRPDSERILHIVYKGDEEHGL